MRLTADTERLTPPWLSFRIDTPLPIDMYPGRQITYRIKLRGLPMRWISEISDFQPPERFVDEQRKGPYRTWIHTHRFVEERGGTRLLDEVEFDMMAAFLVGGLVARDLRRIFTYRHETLLRIFEQPQPWPPAAITISR